MGSVQIFLQACGVLSIGYMSMATLIGGMCAYAKYCDLTNPNRQAFLAMEDVIDKTIATGVVAGMLWPAVVAGVCIKTTQTGN